MATDAAAEQKIRAARGRLAFLRQYFDAAVFSLVLVEEPRCEKVAVDRYKRLYYNPAFVHSLTVEQLVPCVMHELGHVLRDHHKRAAALGVTAITAPIANVTQDGELNDDIRDEVNERKDMPHLPEWVWYPEKFGAKVGGVWEKYFLDLMNDATIEFVRASSLSQQSGGDGDDGEESTGGTGGQQQGRSGEGGSKGKPRVRIRVIEHDCGSGAHGVQREWEQGEPTGGNAEGVMDADWEDIKRITAEKIADRQKSRGDVPGSWVSWANDLLRPRRIPWDQELASGLRWSLNMVAGLVLHSYARPSRRSSALPDFVLPSLRRPKPFVCIVGDTSGSMSDRELALVRGVVEDICRAMGAQVAFLATDAAVHGGVQKVGGGRELTLAGRGGTDMCVGIDYAMKNLRPQPDIIVVVTDCETPWPEKRPHPARVIVCATGKPDASLLNQIPSWAKTILVDPENTSTKE